MAIGGLCADIPCTTFLSAKSIQKNNSEDNVSQNPKDISKGKFNLLSLDVAKNKF
jgi:hypothetical protein